MYRIWDSYIQGDLHPGKTIGGPFFETPELAILAAPMEHVDCIHNWRSLLMVEVGEEGKVIRGTKPPQITEEEKVIFVLRWLLEANQGGTRWQDWAEGFLRGDRNPSEALNAAQRAVGAGAQTVAITVYEWLQESRSLDRSLAQVVDWLKKTSEISYLQKIAEQSLKSR